MQFLLIISITGTMASHPTIIACTDGLPMVSVAPAITSVSKPSTSILMSKEERFPLITESSVSTGIFTRFYCYG
ncbi:MAG: hypothetical protein QM791_20935 [Ferruginibacter sp.]